MKVGWDLMSQIIPSLKTTFKPSCYCHVSRDTLYKKLKEKTLTKNYELISTESNSTIIIFDILFLS